VSAPSDESRLARLEERLAWFERHVAEQDKAMLELSEMVDKLRRELLVLRDRQSTAPNSGGLMETPSEQERPPHY
jgi:SlyX protein